MNTNMNKSTYFNKRDAKQLCSVLDAIRGRHKLRENIELLESSMSSCSLQEKNGEYKENVIPVRRSAEEKPTLEKNQDSDGEDETWFSSYCIVMDEPTPLNIRFLRTLGRVPPTNIKGKIINREVVTIKRRSQKLKSVNSNRGLRINEDQGSSRKSSTFDLKCLDGALPPVSNWIEFPKRCKAAQKKSEECRRKLLFHHKMDITRPSPY